MHWSKIPTWMYGQIDKLKDHYDDVTVVTFERSTIWDVWAHVAADKLPQLVKNHYLHIPTMAVPDPPTVGQVVNELKARLQKMDPKDRKKQDSHAIKRKQYQRQATIDNFQHLLTVLFNKAHRLFLREH